MTNTHHRDIIPFSHQQIEFVKNTNSVSVVVRGSLFRSVGLATNGVCVFGALTSVSALFNYRKKDRYEKVVCFSAVLGDVINA